MLSRFFACCYKQQLIKIIQETIKFQSKPSQKISKFLHALKISGALLSFLFPLSLRKNRTVIIQNSFGLILFLLPLPMFVFNIPHTKSVSIIFTSLKTDIFCYMMTLIALQLSQDPFKNTSDESTLAYFKLLRILLFTSLLIDAMLFIYVFCGRQFPKAVYYVFYIYHWVIKIVCCLQGLQRFSLEKTSPLGFTVIGGYVAASIVYQVNALMVMNGEVYFALKYLHFGSNLVWVAICFALEASHYSHMGARVIAVIHAALSILNLGFLILSQVFGKRTEARQVWKIMALFSILLMIICYLIVLVESQHVYRCHALKLFFRLYQRYGLFELVSPIFLLFSLRGYTPDPWTLRKPKPAQFLPLPALKGSELITFAQQL